MRSRKIPFPRDDMIAENKEIKTMTTYKITWDADWKVLRCEFGGPANNDQILRDAAEQIAAIKQLVMGPQCLKVNGRMSVQVASLITAELAHVVAAIAFYDPKMHCYIITATHSPDYQFAQLVADPEPMIV